MTENQVKQVESKVYELADVEQGSTAWKLLRVGKITSSRLGDIMTTPRSKTELFSDTGKNYLYGVASEKNLRPSYLEEGMIQEFFERVDVITREMKYGTENEPRARVQYAKKNGLSYEFTDTDGSVVSTKDCGNGKIVEVGFVECLGDLQGYGDSPDGLVYNEKNELVGAVEIKCPKSATFMKYKALFESGLSLKEIEPKYYWQCIGHCLANNIEWCDFVFYDKMMKDSLQVKRIYAYKDVVNEFNDVQLLRDKIKFAISFVNSLVSNELEMTAE